MPNRQKISIEEKVRIVQEYLSRRFTSRKELVDMIENYIRYYNNRRVQRNLGVLTPMEKQRKRGGRI